MDDHPTFHQKYSQQLRERKMKMFFPWSGLKVWLVLSAIFVASSSSSTSQAQVRDKSCPDTCGDIPIPYPFGIGESCSLSDGFQLSCNNSNPDDPRVFLASASLDNHELTSIDLESSQVQALISISYQCYNASDSTENSLQSVDLRASPYRFSYEKNIFIAIGCNTLAYIYDSKGINYIGGCITWCENMKGMMNGSCSGTSCCQTSIQQGIRNYSLTFNSWGNHSNILDFNPCSYAFIVKKDYYNFSTSDLTYMDPNRKFPLLLDWAIGDLTCEKANMTDDYACVAKNSYCEESTNGPGYVCKCSKGYRGNPYLQNGCEDIDECQDMGITCNGVCVNTNGSYTCTCPRGTTGNPTGDGCVGNGFSKWAKLGLGIGVGVPLLFIVGSCIVWVIQKRKFAKLKEDFFRQNGGLFLQEKITSSDHMNTFRIFTMVEMEKATDKFDEQRILGRGGNGVVYKGFLHDGRTVAIKKCMMVDSSKNKEFANELLILSKINHVNVVKLLGCCLEVEAPMLVYEYIQNGTLFQHIHSKRQEHQIPWDLRLKVGVESAKALTYLHSEASPPILHGDIKSSNILLDDNFTAKVSDFGTSTFAPKDKSRFMTLIQGTYGYLDPEYLQTGDLTDKSDVYSFGVVMVELLTGKKAIYTDDENKPKNLVFEFISKMKEGRLVEILDAQIMDGNTGTSSNSSMEDISVVADVVMQCLSITGEERPTISHVSVVLEGLRRSERHPWAQPTTEEMESLLGMQESLSSSDPNTNEYPSIKTTEIEMKNIGSGR